MKDALREVGDDMPLGEAVRTAVIRFNALPAAAVPAHQQRMKLILHVPELQAHGTLRYAAWRAVIAEFVAGRLQREVDDLMPQLVGHLALGAALAAYTEWLRNPAADLGKLLHQAFVAFDVRVSPT
jgi:glycerol uptake facilitator-like aquaporin